MSICRTIRDVCLNDETNQDKEHPIQAFCEHVRLNLDQSQLFVLCCSICTLLKDQILSNAQVPFHPINIFHTMTTSFNLYVLACIKLCFSFWNFSALQHTLSF